MKIGYGEILKAHRKAAKLTQKNVAALLDIETGNYSAIENESETRPVSVEKLLQICDLPELGISIENKIKVWALKTGSHPSKYPYKDAIIKNLEKIAPQLDRINALEEELSGNMTPEEYEDYCKNQSLDDIEQDLLARKKPAQGLVALPDIVMIPVVTNKVAAGRGLCMEDTEQAIEWYEPIPAKLVRNPKESVFFEVEGDSMENRLFSGDLVLVDCSLEPQSGHLVVVQVEDRLMVKKLQSKGGYWLLHSYNPKYEPIKVDKGFQQCWRVVNIWGKG